MRDRDDEFDLDESDDLDDEAGDSDAIATMPCPHCLGTIFDDSERCPRCGEYLTREAAPSRPPWWVVVGVGIALVIVARWIVGAP